MPGPHFVSCSVCHKQILPHSLAVHEAKCLEKWCMENNQANMGVSPTVVSGSIQNVKQKLKTSTTKKRLATTAVLRPAAVVNPQLQAVGNKVATNSVKAPGTTFLGRTMILESSVVEMRKVSTDPDLSSPSLAQRYRAGSVDEKRPGTVTLSPAGRAASLDRAGVGISDETAVCYVCGQRCGRNVVETHEKKCLHIWQCLVAKLPPAIRVYKPQKLQHPSLDGTIDPSRLESLAQKSAQRSQKVDCSRCRTTGIDLLAAREHVRQCGTKKPDRPVKNDGTSGNSNKPKRKKAKEREIFVNIFA